MRYICALVAVAWVLVSCGREPRPLVLLLPGHADMSYWRLAHVGAIQAALELDVDVSVGPVRGRKPVGYVVGPGQVVPDDRFAVALQTPSDTTAVRSEVGADYRNGGEQAALWIGDMMVGEGDIAILAADLDQPAVRERIEGFAATVKARFPGMRIVHRESVGSSRTEAQQTMARVLSNFRGLRVLYADSEPVALGTVDLLKARGNTRVRTIACAKADSLIDDLRTRVIDGLLVENAVGAGHAAVSAVVRFRRGESVPRTIAVPMVMVRRFDMEKPEVVELLRPDVQGWLNRLKTRI